MFREEKQGAAIAAWLATERGRWMEREEGRKQVLDGEP